MTGNNPCIPIIRYSCLVNPDFIFHAMIISIEISYYPLHGDDFIEPIKAFIDRLNSHPKMEVHTNGMSTQVFGEYDKVMEILQKEIRASFENPYSVFVMKVVNADLRVHAKQ